MSRTNTDDLPGSTAPILGPQLLARIQELNLDYLELLIAQRACTYPGAQCQHLPARLPDALAALPRQARSVLAAAPFTLYSLGFENEGSWRVACETTARPVVPIEQRYAPADGAGAQGPFLEVALLHAWHVATSSRLAARVIYAMPEATASRLMATPLWQIKRIAAEHPVLLMPRWPTNPAFWPDLVRFAAAGDAKRLATAKLLGSQLIAAELAVADGSVGSLASPRLRARRGAQALRVR